MLRMKPFSCQNSRTCGQILSAEPGTTSQRWEPGTLDTHLVDGLGRHSHAGRDTRCGGRGSTSLVRTLGAVGRERGNALQGSRRERHNDRLRWAR